MYCTKWPLLDRGTQKLEEMRGRDPNRRRVVQFVQNERFVQYNRESGLYDMPLRGSRIKILLRGEVCTVTVHLF